LRLVVASRLEGPLQKRVDASDVVQETLVVASQRVHEFLEDRQVSFRVWLRRTAIERLIDVRRRHLAKKRDVRRDRSIADASSMAVALLQSKSNSGDPTQLHERNAQVAEAIAQLPENDQEILLLRHIEGLTNVEMAQVLEIDPRAASKRYGRAVARLSSELRRLGFLDSAH